MTIGKNWVSALSVLSLEHMAKGPRPAVCCLGGMQLLTLVYYLHT